MATQCTKFEVSIFSHSGDILGGLILMGHVTITTPILVLFVIPLARLDIPVSLCTKFDSSGFSHT